VTKRALDGGQRVGRASLRVAVEAFERYREQQMTDRAAGLTYFAMMSLFPSALVGVTLLGLFVAGLFALQQITGSPL